MNSLNTYTVVALHDVGLRWIIEVQASSAEEAIKAVKKHGGTVMACFHGDLSDQYDGVAWSSTSFIKGD